MKEFDYVIDTVTNNEGLIVKLNKKTAYVSFSDEPIERKRLKVISEIELDETDLGKIFRLSDFNEIKYRAILSLYPVKSTATYTPTLQDLRSLLMNIKIFNITKQTFDFWVFVVNVVIGENYLENGQSSEDIYDAYLLKSERDVFDYVFAELAVNCENTDELISNLVDIDQLIKEVQNNIDCQDLTQKAYQDNIKEIFVAEVCDRDDIDNLDAVKKEIFKRFSLDLADKGSLVGREALAYSYYGGNSVFECDWQKAEELLLDLYQSSGNPTYANSLGFIYYYGRTNNNIPQNDLAFKYYSIAYASGNYEAQYKIADMFLQGKSVVKNKAVTENIYDTIYTENLALFQKGFYDCKLADIALRMASQQLQQEHCDVYVALWYILVAKKAIEIRMENHNIYGDDTVKENIDKIYQACVALKEKEKQPLVLYYPGFLDAFFQDGQFASVELKELKNGRLKIQVTQLNRDNDLKYRRFIPLFEQNDCLFVDQLTVYGCGDVKYWAKKAKFTATHIKRKEDTLCFYNCNEVVAEIVADYYQIYRGKNKKG
ncbi:MAG: tetratricopeptide repeat protein [Erysipelotrichaceae bacterium]